MNYLSHFYASDTYTDRIRLASLFPDIFPKFSFIHNKYLLNFDLGLLTELEMDFWLGIQIHYADDTYFHSMKSFTLFNRRIEDLMAMTELKNLKRKFLVSHILYELILDHWIINNHPNMAFQIYEISENIPPKSIENFFTKIIKDQSLVENLIASYSRFKERRFLYFYLEEANLVKALHRVTGKISQWEYNDLTEKSFISIIQQVKTEINYEEIFASVIKNRKLS